MPSIRKRTRKSRHNSPDKHIRPFLSSSSLQHVVAPRPTRLRPPFTTRGLARLPTSRAVVSLLAEAGRACRILRYGDICCCAGVPALITRSSAIRHEPHRTYSQPLSRTVSGQQPVFERYCVGQYLQFVIEGTEWWEGWVRHGCGGRACKPCDHKIRSETGESSSRIPVSRDGGFLLDVVADCWTEVKPAPERRRFDHICYLLCLRSHRHRYQRSFHSLLSYTTLLQRPRPPPRPLRRKPVCFSNSNTKRPRLRILHS